MKIYIRRLSLLYIISTVIVLLIILPSTFLISELMKPVTESWIHIKTYLLEEYIKNSIVLIVSVGIITAILGTFFSWSLEVYDFKYNKLLMGLLFLPLAIPPYIAGYIYGGIFGYSGTLERIFMKFNLDPVRIDILSMNGAIFIFVLFLSPYVILVTRSFFARLPASFIESAVLLGKSPFQVFLKIVLPISRGAIIGGVILVILEVLNDYGLVKYFGIPTFSTAIYTTWFGLGDVHSAIRLASNLMIIVFIVMALEHYFRGKGKISQSRASAKYIIKKPPSKIFKSIFYLIYIVYIGFSLIIPVIQLIWWSSLSSNRVILRDIGQLIVNTLLLALFVTVIIIFCSIIIGNFNRLSNSFLSSAYARIIILGYSIPASIIAIAVLIFFLKVDKLLKPIYLLLEVRNLFLTGSIVMLIFALTIRFMAIGFNSIESGFNKIGIKYYETSRLLGKSGIKTFFKVDLPMLKPAIISAVILTFVDVLKELPLTLILRPFNFDTLATKVYTYAGDEMIHEASFFALIIIAISISGIIFLQHLQKEKSK